MTKKELKVNVILHSSTLQKPRSRKSRLIKNTLQEVRLRSYSYDYAGLSHHLKRMKTQNERPSSIFNHQYSLNSYERKVMWILTHL